MMVENALSQLLMLHWANYRQLLKHIFASINIGKQMNEKRN